MSTKNLQEMLTEEELEILRQIKPSFKKQKIRLRTRQVKWDDPPPVLDGNDPTLDWDVDGDRACQRAKHGQVYVEYKTNIKAKQIRKEGKEEVEEEVTVQMGMMLWAVINPTNLERFPNGSFIIPNRWIPRVWNEELQEWIIASDSDCENWKNIPPEKRRVDWCIGVLPDY